MKKKVIELFAGVGGFRVGLNNVKKINDNGIAIENGPFDFVWANQWEPSTSKQYAYQCYKTRFNGNERNCSNLDISLVNKNKIPTHTLLCGGFPCQDYSVARSLSGEKGIEGKKGVLWWQIVNILKTKKPPFVLLENVDRLLKSPSKQRGRDFGIMLRCFADNGYGVEWRVINAAEYGHPQRRRRIYIFAFRKNTRYFKSIKEDKIPNVLFRNGIFAKAFPVQNTKQKIVKINLLSSYTDLIQISNNFVANFLNSGLMLNGFVYTTDLVPIKNSPIVLKEIVEEKVNKKYYLSKDQLQKFKYLKSGKKVPRKKPNGEQYFYSEGPMSQIDSLNLPGRTMLTSEGTINRSTHIIKDSKGVRILTPLECERLNQFPNNWTNTMPERNRYFMMGNALVCGIISKIGKIIDKIIDLER